MNLTTEERVTAERVVAQMEKEARVWSLYRWLAIAFSTVIMFSVILVMKQVGPMFSPCSSQITAATFDAKHVQKAIDCAVAELGVEISLNVFGACCWVMFCICAGSLVYLFANRDRGLKMAVQAKLLREALRTIGESRQNAEQSLVTTGSQHHNDDIQLKR